MKENIIKLAITTGLATFAGYFQLLVIPLVILMCMMCLDYGTGMAKAFSKHEISSRIGVLGIIKKVGYLLIVAVGMCTDYLIISVGDTVGVEIPNNFTIGLLVIIWLIINELISILENVAIMGAPVPSFLIKIIEKLKVSTENQIED